jgi:hypothetical protein
MPIKKFFQLRLLTLLAISLCAAGILGLNLISSPGYPYIADWELHGDVLRSAPIIKHYPSIGWPLAFIYHNPQVTFIGGDGSGSGLSLPIFHPESLNDGPMINRKNLAIDLGIALFVLLSVGTVCEWALRRQRSCSSAANTEPIVNRKSTIVN